MITLSEIYDLSLDYLLKGDNNYMSKLKKDRKKLNFLRVFFIVQTILMISVGTHLLVITGSATTGFLVSLGIFGVLTLGSYLISKK